MLTTFQEKHTQEFHTFSFQRGPSWSSDQTYITQAGKSHLAIPASKMKNWNLSYNSICSPNLSAFEIHVSLLLYLMLSRL